ncbi:hypothetical protein [Kitasatospora kifunensis]|uniref:Uncharacterized protein n=1 Tax=Kitasatospora kifunensis TaxID=58351 RepID=A0A7W7RBH0_KITKI|nr:hypothetical protein [Kitasatospora kifunensis]MBB4928628.1 hypothetical protein [Kitasatospora kifunensis]
MKRRQSPRRPPRLRLPRLAPSREAIRRRYGASSLHLLLVLCSFALAGYAGVRLLKGEPLKVALWFVGAAFAHDLLLLPLYTLTDRAAQALARRLGSTGQHPRVPQVNYVRVPVFLSLLLLSVWYPLVLRRVPGYQGATGLGPDSFLGHWLLITATLFALSALCLITATIRNRPPKPRPAKTP